MNISLIGLMTSLIDQFWYHKETFAINTIGAFRKIPQINAAWYDKWSPITCQVMVYGKLVWPRPALFDTKYVRILQVYKNYMIKKWVELKEMESGKDFFFSCILYA